MKYFVSYEHISFYEISIQCQAYPSGMLILSCITKESMFYSL